MHGKYFHSFSTKRNVFTVAFEMIFVISAGNGGKNEAMKTIVKIRCFEIAREVSEEKFAELLLLRAREKG